MSECSNSWLWATDVPKVSIVIPVYCGSDYLSDAIESALAQTYRNTEILVINDGSNDDGKTERVAMSYSSKIRYISKSNGGVASALNAGIRAMRGDYFSWLSHDDVYMPDKIEVQMGHVLQTTNPTVCYSDFETIDEHGRSLEMHIVPHLAPLALRPSLMFSANVHGCSLLIPRQLFDEVGMFDESLRTTQDYDLWFRMAARFPFEHINRTLVRARIHANQGTNRMRLHVAREIDTLYRRYLKALGREEIAAYWPDGIFDYFMKISKSMHGRGYRSAAACAFVLAIRHFDIKRSKQVLERAVSRASDRMARRVTRRNGVIK